MAGFVNPQKLHEELRRPSTRKYDFYRKKLWHARLDVWPLTLAATSFALMTLVDLTNIPASEDSPKRVSSSREFCTADVLAEASVNFGRPLTWTARNTEQVKKNVSNADLFPVLSFLFSSVWFLYFVSSLFLGSLLHLSTHWWVLMRCIVCCSRVTRVEEATDVLVTQETGKPLERRTLCPLFKCPRQTYFFLQKKKYVFDRDSQEFQPLCFPKDLLLPDYMNWKGLEITPATSSKQPQISPQWDALVDKSVSRVHEKYGANEYDIPIPSFNELFKEHALSPFFVFQVFSISLWLLDEYWQYSLMTLAMLIILECQMVRKRIKDFQQLRGMRVPVHEVHVYRSDSWHSILSNALLPGDIFSLTASGTAENAICPVDALLLHGVAVVNEATLTGESVPQTKVALDVDDFGEEAGLKQRLDMKLRNKQNIVFAGTSVILHRNPEKNFKKKTIPGNGCIAFVLRNGFSTTQGKLVRTILYSHGRVTVSSKEAWYFLGVLLVLALCASAYVVKQTLAEAVTGAAERSRFKLFLSCSHIIMAVVPAEFPITLSLAVTMSLIFFLQKQIFCTEPFRVPFAGKVDVCAFDKTGTLTADCMRVQGVYGVSPSTSLSATSSHTSTTSDMGVRKRVLEMMKQTLKDQHLPFESTAVMGCCHSLALVDKQVVGDPMEKAAFSAVGWTLAENGDAIAFRGDSKVPEKLSILKRYPFTSELQRMVVIARREGPGLSWASASADSSSNSSRNTIEQLRVSALDNSTSIETAKAPGHKSRGMKTPPSTPQLIVAAKGSPEMMRSLLKEVPDFYDCLCREFCVKGYRVLTLAYKALDAEGTAQEIHHYHGERRRLESNLCFVGLLVLTCPIKRGTRYELSVIKKAGHRVLMVTGDNPLTACQVAQDLGIVSLQQQAAENKQQLQQHDEVLVEKYEKACDDDSEISSSSQRPVLILSCREGFVEGFHCSEKLEKNLKSGQASRDVQNQQESRKVQSHSEEQPVDLHLGEAAVSRWCVTETTQHDRGKAPASDCCARKRLATPKNSNAEFSSDNLLLSPLLVAHSRSLLYWESIEGTTVAAEHLEDKCFHISSGASRKSWRGFFSFLKCSSSVKARELPHSLLPVLSTAALPNLADNYELCVTGSSLTALFVALKANTVQQQVEAMQLLTPYVAVYARMSPQQKELLLLALNASGLTTLMCGDGTNDVGALKAAHVGVSLLGHSIAIIKKSNVRSIGSRTCSQNRRSLHSEAGNSTGFCTLIKKTSRSPHGTSQRGVCVKHTTRAAAAHDFSITHNTTTKAASHATTRVGGDAGRQKLREYFREIVDQNDEDLPMIRLGDASVASPFTYKGDSIKGIPTILRAGRATLVTVVMMYKLMALNSVVTAFSLSVLTLDGVKLGDLQTMLENLLCTALTLLISKTHPCSEHMGSCRPISSVFHPTVVLSLTGQAAIHCYTLYSSWMLARASAAPDWKPDVDGPFEPNIVNSVVFLLLASMHASTFLSNYEGAPFMLPLFRNKPFCVCLGVLFLSLFFLVSEVVPDFNTWLGLVPFPDATFKWKIIFFVFLDIAGSWAIGCAMRKLGCLCARNRRVLPRFLH